MRVNIAEKHKKENVMFAQLPPQIQAQIKNLLLLNDFRAAKALYDKFLHSED